MTLAFGSWPGPPGTWLSLGLHQLREQRQSRPGEQAAGSKMASPGTLLCASASTLGSVMASSEPFLSLSFSSFPPNPPRPRSRALT